MSQVYNPGFMGWLVLVWPWLRRLYWAAMVLTVIGGKGDPRAIAFCAIGYPFLRDALALEAQRLAVNEARS